MFSTLSWILPSPSSPLLILEASSTFVVPLERMHAYQSPFWKGAGPASQFVLTCWKKTSPASLQEHNHRTIWTRRDRFWMWFFPEHTTSDRSACTHPEVLQHLHFSSVEDEQRSSARIVVSLANEIWCCNTAHYNSPVSRIQKHRSRYGVAAQSENIWFLTMFVWIRSMTVQLW